MLHGRNVDGTIVLWKLSRFENFCTRKLLAVLKSDRAKRNASCFGRVQTLTSTMLRNVSLRANGFEWKWSRASRPSDAGCCMLTAHFRTLRASIRNRYYVRNRLALRRASRSRFFSFNYRSFRATPKNNFETLPNHDEENGSCGRCYAVLGKSWSTRNAQFSPESMLSSLASGESFVISRR